MSKRLVVLFMMSLLAFAMIAGCGGQEAEEGTTAEPEAEMTEEVEMTDTAGMMDTAMADTGMMEETMEGETGEH